MIYEYELGRDPETNTLVKRIKSVNYPDLIPAFSHATSHLNMMIDVPFWMAEVLTEDWEGLFLHPLKARYQAEKDEEALRILDFLDSWIKRNIYAEVDGSQQDYNVRLHRGHVVEQRVKPIE
jgi:hypothetical protein